MIEVNIYLITILHTNLDLTPQSASPDLNSSDVGFLSVGDKNVQHF